MERLRIELWQTQCRAKAAEFSASEWTGPLTANPDCKKALRLSLRSRKRPMTGIWPVS